MSMPNPGSNDGNGPRAGGGAVQVTLDARPDQRLIPRRASFRHLDLGVRATKPAGAVAREREPLTLALVLDRSGSMSGDKVETAKRAALAVIERLDERDTAAVVIFDDQIDVLQPAASVTEDVKRDVRGKLADIGARASTALHQGWLTGCQAIASTDLTPPVRGVARCFLLTDGQANVGMVDPEQIAAQAANIRERARIGTSTFGIGLDYAEELLGPMAEAGGGRFHHLRDAGEIATTFINELGELLATAASSVKVELEVEPGTIVDVISTYWATPAPENPTRWTISLGDLFEGEERHAVVRLGFADEPKREEQAARVRLLWTAEGAEQTSAWSELRFTYADDAAVAADPIDATVVEAAGQQLTDRTQRDALRLSKSGDLAGAQRVLRHSHALLADYALSAPSLATEVDEIDSLAQQIAERPLPSDLSKERYLQAQLRSSGKRDLRGAADDRLAPAERVQQLLAGYIKSSVAWPQAVPDPFSDSQAEVVRDRVRGCLLWGAVGDALGRPLQGLTPSEIQARYGQAGLTRYLPPREWRSGPTGVYTSDTALAVELARSLVAGAGNLDPAEFAQRLALQWSALPAVGAMTEHALQRLAYGVPWWEAAHPQSAGGAAAVRAAPVGLVHALATSPLALRQQAVLAALPTHRTGTAVAGAVALAAGVAWLVREVARGAEQVDAAAFAGFVADAVAGIEPPASGNAPQLTQRLRTLAPALAHATPEQAFAGFGHSTRALDAVPAAFFHFLRSPDDPRQAVSAAANRGHSATAVASMAGQLAGAWSGAERLARLAPPWWDELEGRDDLCNLADQLAALTLQARGR